MLLSKDWIDYECIDAGNGEKIERWGSIILRRPDPQAMWSNDTTRWLKEDAFYKRSDKGGGAWHFSNSNAKKPWTVTYRDLVFKIEPTNFKHVGLFPEQAVNWDYAMEKIKQADRPIRVLNLFAYTGAATVACSKAGANEVVHVDSSKGMVDWAKENLELSGIADHSVRFIVEDCLKFVEREYRRGRQYDVIIMDPPSYGRGSKGEVWKFEDDLHLLIDRCLKILSEDALFFLVNAYTTGISSIVLENILKTTILPKYPNSSIEAGELALPIMNRDMVLPCGIYARWSRN